MKHIIVVVLLSLLVSCSENPPKVRISNDKMVQFAPSDTTAEYFPDNRTGRNYLEEWANKVLFKLKEPLLYSYSGEGEFVRLTWLRAFDNPVVVRVNKFNDTIYSSIKELKLTSFQSESPPILRDTIVALDASRWREVLQPINQNDFWNAGYAENNIGKDGAIWFLECRLQGKYHVIQRWDDSYLTSLELNKYLMPLINLGREFVQMKSSR